MKMKRQRHEEAQKIKLIFCNIKAFHISFRSKILNILSFLMARHYSMVKYNFFAFYNFLDVNDYFFVNIFNAYEHVK